MEYKQKMNSIAKIDGLEDDDENSPNFGKPGYNREKSPYDRYDNLHSRRFENEDEAKQWLSK